ncbi:MAG TPA: alanine racemase [Aggregatilineaceae bacterium]|nr:alanine racemase [Aggregatilineaceae bacterium]
MRLSERQYHPDFEHLGQQSAAYAEIRVDALVHNLTAIRQHIGQNVRFMAVLKANAYGHGLIGTARAVLPYIDTLGVARVSEGIKLRQAGITAPIMVLYYATPDETVLSADYNLIPTVNDVETAAAFSQRAVALGKTLPVQVMVDTGMDTFGQLPNEVIPFIQHLQTLLGIRIEGIFTHFATADAKDTTFTGEQVRHFQTVLNNLESAGINIPLSHASNSPGTLWHPDANFNMVRCGIAMYGLGPTRDLLLPFELKPALSLKSHIARTRTLPAGSSFGYGRSYISRRPIQVALIPVGYGDGYHRLISNRGMVLIRGQHAPIIGRISMDQFTVDVSHIEGVQLHEEVVLIGQQDKAQITADQVAAWAETINYEITTSLTDRIPRIYLEKDQPNE